MDIQQLIYFTTVAKTGNYSAASRQLYISQSALSKSIKKLEYELDTHLFSQVDKKTELTDTGKLLFEKAVPFLEEYDSILDTMREVAMQKKGYLRLGIPYGLGRILFDELISDFSVEYPNIVIDLCGHGSQHIQELVLEGKIEIGACIQPPKIPETLDSLPLMHDRFFLLVHKKHPLSAKESVFYSELQNESFYMLNNDYTMTAVTKANCARAGFTPAIKLIVNRSDIMADLVSKGQGVAVIAGGRWRFEDHPDLKILDLKDGENDFDITLITKKGAYLPYAAKYFIDYCKARLFQAAPEPLSYTPEIPRSMHSPKSGILEHPPKALP